MDNIKTSKKEKHEHAVIVCSVIGKPGRPDYIIDKKEQLLNFINLRDNFLSEKHLIISKEEKKVFFKISKDEYDIWKKNDSQTLDERKPDESEYVSECDVLGEYDWEHKRVFLYTRNIEKLCNKSNNKTNEHEEKKYIVETYIHELFHAFFHHETLQAKNQYNHIRDYILEIEETLTEFCVLYFLKNMRNNPFYIRLKGFFNFDEDEMSEFALQDIRNKQNAVGPLAAYGFGAYLFEKLGPSNQYKLINNYIQKLGYIDENDDKVKEYRRKVRFSYFVPGYQEDCLNLLKDILEPSAN